MTVWRTAFGWLQKIGKSLMLPVSVLPAAGILLGVGSAKFAWLPVVVSDVMAQAGGAVFGNLPLIFAIGVALGLTANDGVAALASVVGFAVIAFAANAFLPVFWCLPAALLSGTAAAGGIALINSIGNLGGFFSPNLIGMAKSMTGSYAGSLWMLGAFAIVAALMVLPIARTPALRRRVE